MHLKHYQLLSLKVKTSFSLTSINGTKGHKNMHFCCATSKKHILSYGHTTLPRRPDWCEAGLSHVFLWGSEQSATCWSTELSLQHARTCQRREIFHIRQVLSTALCKHSRERWGANASCLWLCSPCIAVLVITTPSDFLTTHSPTDGSGCLRSHSKGGYFWTLRCCWDVSASVELSPDCLNRFGLTSSDCCSPASIPSRGVGEG